MKKLIFTFVIVFIAIFSIAQPIGNSWHFSYQSSISTGYIKLNYVKDTTTELGDFQVLEKIRIEHSWPGFYDTTYLDREYLQWKNDSVFRLIDNEVALLFNFNANIGDTLVFRKKNPIDPACDSIGKGVVNSTGLQLIQGTNRKWISVTPVSGSVVGLHGKIVEGIGPVEDYFFPEYIACVADANEGGPFRCIAENDQIIYNTDIVEYCDYVKSILDEKAEEHIIFPNPAENEINIILEKNEKINISIFDISGKIIFNTYESTGETGIISIDVSDWVSGIYIIETKGKNISRAKFVKE